MIPINVWMKEFKLNRFLTLHLLSEFDWNPSLEFAKLLQINVKQNWCKKHLLKPESEVNGLNLDNAWKHLQGEKKGIHLNYGQ